MAVKAARADIRDARTGQRRAYPVRLSRTTRYVDILGPARRSLAVKTLQDIGMKNIAEMTSGLAAWHDTGGPDEQRGLTALHVR